MAQPEPERSAWWDEPVRRFRQHLTSLDSSGERLYRPVTAWWCNWAITDFCLAEFSAFTNAPPGSREEVVEYISGMMVGADLTIEATEATVGTKRSYYSAISWWFSWSRENVPGCENLPSLGRESFGKKKYRRKRQASSNESRGEAPADTLKL